MMGEHTVLVQPLEIAQPLAHRLLKSILVKCPLRTAVACNWKGDYGDLDAHLLSKTAHSADLAGANAASTGTCVVCDDPTNTMEVDSVEDRMQQQTQHREQQISLAASLKEEANGKFQSGHFREAESLYSKAIEVMTNIPLEQESPSSSSSEKVLLATLYSNRAAAYLQFHQFSFCLEDCQRVIHDDLDPQNSKVFLRAARANVQLGQLKAAEKVLAQGEERHTKNSTLRKEKQEISRLMELEARGYDELSSERFAAAKGTFGVLLKTASSAAPFLLGAAQADLGLGLSDSALRLTKRVLVMNPQNPQGYLIRGQAIFLMGDDPKVAIQLLQEALRLDPDSNPLKHSYKQAKQVHQSMAEAQKCMFSRKFEEAVSTLTLCIETYQPLPAKAALYAKLYTQRAEAFLRLKQFTNAMKDCALVVYAQEDCIPAWVIRFQAHHGLGEHSAALEQVKDLLQKWPQDHRLRQAYDRADFLVRRGKRVDFYKLLDVPSIASEMEIKKAYKRKALELHPDKLPPGSSPDEQRKAQRRFQQLGEGLEILCDDFQRKLYDEGYDSEAIRERVEAAKQAAHNHRGRYPQGHHH